MATLLIISSSIYPEAGSASRSVIKTFREEWIAQHPQGTVIERDLSVAPVPHLTAPTYLAGFVPPADRDAEQAAAHALRDELIEELEQADAVVIGAPMYNFSIPSTLKAWLDHVITMGRTTGDESTVKDKPAIVVASRGGSYAPGTPREDYEFVQTYLEKALGGGGLGLDVHFIVPELTLAAQVEAMKDLVPLSDASKEKAHSDAAAKAKELVSALV